MDHKLGFLQLLQPENESVSLGLLWMVKNWASLGLAWPRSEQLAFLEKYLSSALSENILHYVIVH